MLSGHTDRPAAVCVTPDGGLVASGGSYDDPSVRVWDPAAATCVHTLPGHEGTVTAIAVTAKGSRLVTGSDDTTVRVWDLATGSVKVLRAHREAVRSVATTPDGRRMVSCGDAEQVILWDLERGRRLRTLGRRRRTEAGWGRRFSAVAITADGQLVIGACRSGLKVWDAETGDVLRSLEPPSGAVAAIEHVASTADGSLALTGSYDGILNLWDVTRGYHEFTEAELFTGSVSSVSFTAAGDALVTGDDGALFVNSRTERGRKTVSVQAGGSGRQWNAAAISADGARVLATGADGAIAIYKSHRRLHTLKASDRYLDALETGPDGRQLLAGGEDKTLRLWDLEHATAVRRVHRPSRRGQRRGDRAGRRPRRLGELQRWRQIIEDADLLERRDREAHQAREGTRLTGLLPRHRSRRAPRRIGRPRPAIAGVGHAER